jgi:hypothetical protein
MAWWPAIEHPLWEKSNPITPAQGSIVVEGNPQMTNITQSTQSTQSTQTAELAAGLAALKTQRILLAICIFLAPLSITLYLVAWSGSGREPLAAAAVADTTGNTLRLIGAVAASFFLPLGYLGMSLLGMRRAPWLATFSVILSLVGWIPWAALIVLDDLAITIDRTGSTPQLAALWTRVNGDPVMSTFLLIYVIGHLLSAVFIGYMLGRLRIIPVWAAWAFALSSPLTIAIFPIHNTGVQEVLKYLICILLFVGAIPAAFAMLRGRNRLSIQPDAESSAR